MRCINAQCKVGALYLQKKHILKNHPKLQPSFLSLFKTTFNIKHVCSSLVSHIKIPFIYVNKHAAFNIKCTVTNLLCQATKNHLTNNLYVTEVWIIILHEGNIFKILSNQRNWKLHRGSERHRSIEWNKIWNSSRRMRYEPAKKRTFGRSNNTRGQRQICEEFCYAIHVCTGLYGL